MGRTELDHYEPGFKSLLIQLMKQLGLDPSKCYRCGKQGKCDIHHLKYEGATLFDLVFACRRCNLANENKGLV